MFTVFIIMLIGIASGYFLRRFPDIKFIGKLISCFIFILLFFLGISVGTNEKIVNNLDTIGLQALIITIGAIAGSVLLSWWLYAKVFIKGKSTKRENTKEHE